jgi:hypothetical protein
MLTRPTPYRLFVSMPSTPYYPRASPDLPIFQVGITVRSAGLRYAMGTGMASMANEALNEGHVMVDGSQVEFRWEINDRAGRGSWNLKQAVVSRGSQPSQRKVINNNQGRKERG